MGGVTVARPVVGDDVVVLGERRDVMGVGLQVAAGAGHQDQRVARARFQDTGGPRFDLHVPDGVGGVAERDPDGSVAHEVAPCRVSASMTSAVLVISASRPSEATAASWAPGSAALHASATMMVR